MIIVKYQTEEEAQQIIAEKQLKGFVLAEVTNVTEGNFLGFYHPMDFHIANYVISEDLKQRVLDLEAAIAALLGGAGV